MTQQFPSHQPNYVTSFQPDHTLSFAWIRQRIYSENASAAQRRFDCFRASIIALSVLATFFSVTYEQLKNYPINLQPYINQDLLLSVVQRCVLVIPIIVSILVAGAVRFDRGNNWILLRASAEALKREIFYYRTRFGSYKQDRDAVLARKMKLITERLKGTPVNLASVAPSEQEVVAALTAEMEVDPQQRKVDRFSDLTDPEAYLTQRLQKQFEWYRNKAHKLDRRLHLYEWSTYILGGLATLLAATGFEAWVAVSGALTAALTSFLEFKRVEATLIGYNQAADNLYDVRILWLALPEKDRKLDLLVKATEEVIQSENASWLQDMQDRLADLYNTTRPEDELQNSQSHPKSSP